MSADDEASGSELLDEVRRFLCGFVAFPSDVAADAVTLWTAHAHAVEAFESTPRLALLSPEPGSGKTRTLEVLELLVPRPMMALSPSPAAVFRSIAGVRPVLLFDEADVIFTSKGSGDGNEDLRGVLNSGHRKGAAIPRCTGPNQSVTMFPVFAPAALAGLGDLPETLMHRSVVIRMRRRLPGQAVAPFRHRVAAPEGIALHDRLAEWAKSVYDVLENAWPEMPEGITDRPADVWEPLLAVADAAGEDWPDRARAACVELAAAAVSRDASLGIRLLGDIRTVLGDADRMASAELVRLLVALPESPWDDLKGKPLDQRSLAYRLRQYEITPSVVRIGAETPRGFLREDFHDAWGRYLPALPEAQQPQPMQQASSDLGSDVAAVADVEDAGSCPRHRSQYGLHPKCQQCNPQRGHLRAVPGPP